MIPTIITPQKVANKIWVRYTEMRSILKSKLKKNI